MLLLLLLIIIIIITIIIIIIIIIIALNYIALFMVLTQCSMHDLQKDIYTNV